MAQSERSDTSVAGGPDDLLRAVARGDRDAFSALYDLAAPRLYAVCLRVLGPGAEAEEALQEAFVKVWRHADQWPGARGSAMAWLLAIGRHAAIDRRRARVRQERHADGLARGGDVLPVAAPQPAATPEEAAGLLGEARHLAACLDALPDPRADVVRGAYFSGESYAEMARETGHPEGTLKSWVHRSLAALRRCLEERGMGASS